MIGRRSKKNHPVILLNNKPAKTDYRFNTRN
jgi:hypothetical protein